MNFKINTNSEGKVFITPKSVFSNIQDLLEGHKTTPLRSKARPGAKVFLLTPITSAAVQQVLLPPHWQEFYDENYKRSYYYNSQTGQSSWERPKVPAPPTSTTPTKPTPTISSSINRSQTMGPRASNRPLPSLPQEDVAPPTSPRRSLDVGIRARSCPSPNNQRKTSESFNGRANKSPGIREISRRLSREDVPMLPPKDNSRRFSPAPNKPSPALERHEMAPPPLPSKLPSPVPERHVNRQQTPPTLPSKNHAPILPAKIEYTPPPPLPSKNDQPPLPLKSDTPLIPHLPSKTPLSMGGTTPPPLPSKNDCSYGNEVPPLPLKSDTLLPPPPLPQKEESHSIPSPGGKRRQRPVEYVDTIITLPSPSLPAKGGPPIPPPPPPLPPASKCISNVKTDQ